MLKIKLGKAEYDALEDSLKTFYVADGENYKLDSDAEDVDGLKAKRDEFRTKYEAERDRAKLFEGLDPEAVKAALEKVNKADDDDLLNKRKYDELLKKKSDEWDAKEKGLTDKIASMARRQAEQELAMKLTEQGVKPNMAEDLAVTLTAKHIQFIEENGNVVWKTKDGLETIDLDKYIPSLKEGKADYFAPQGGPGSGALGSGTNGGGIDPSKMTAEQKIEYGFQHRK